MTHNRTTIAHRPFDDDYDYAPGAIEVRVSELVVVTAEQNHPLVDETIGKVLKILREQHHSEAAFVSGFIDGTLTRRAFSGPQGGHFHSEQEGDPLEFLVGRQAVPKSAAASGYFSVPVVLLDGALYGTLYAASFAPDENSRAHELKRLAMTAQLAARLINARRAHPGPNALELASVSRIEASSDSQCERRR